MDIPLNVDVHCTDGYCGRSTYIILNPVTERISHLVVNPKQPSGKERLVSVMLVANTSAEVILLNCTKEEFSNLETFNQSEFSYTNIPQHATDPNLTLFWPYVVPVKRIVDDKLRRIPPGELAVRRGTRVNATDGWVGYVDKFVVGPVSGNITHMILREGHQWGKKVICIPVGQIEHFEEKVVKLNIDKTAIGECPEIPLKDSWLE